MRRVMTVRTSYPGLAIVAGASEGMGAAFSRELARRGFDLLLIARRADPLRELANEIRQETGQIARTLQCDLGLPSALAQIEEATAGTDVGMLVYNAAVAPLGYLHDQPEATIESLIGVNIRTPILLIHRLMPAVEAKHTGTTTADPPGRRGVVLLSSMAGWQGGPFLTAYAASKAFLRVLGEGLWNELRNRGVDVVVSVPGATDTPGYRDQSGATGASIGVLSPDRVARAALRRLGRGPISTPGLLYKVSSFVMNRLLPRRWAIRIMGKAGRRLAEKTQRRIGG
jgi:uncharacterized protein